MTSKKLYNSARISAIMNNIVRYCTTPSLIKESVSDHAFLISLLVIETSTDYPELFKYVDRENLLMRATLHDMAESITGDIPAPVKRSIPEGESLFNEIEIKVSNKLCEGRPETFKNLLLMSIKFDNNDVIEEVLFKSLDYFCVLLKTSNELYLGNNYYRRVLREMHDVIYDVRKSIEERVDIKEGYKELLIFYDNEVIELLLRLEELYKC